MDLLIQVTEGHGDNYGVPLCGALKNLLEDCLNFDNRKAPACRQRNG